MDSLQEKGRNSFAPKEQFNPIETNSEWESEVRKASTVLTAQGSSLASVTVPEIIRGMGLFLFSGYQGSP